jgi:suppressor of fused-like protein
LGGPDPLDYISMYANPGDAACGIPPHWHYISFGLSDLHGDGRVHE